MRKMQIKLVFFVLLMAAASGLRAQDVFPVKGLCVAAPEKEDVDEFVALIEKELAPAGVNTLILRVDWGYRYASHPEWWVIIPWREPM